MSRPILSGASGTAIGEATASLSVTNDEGGGTLYWYVSTSATPPSAANLKADVGAAEFDNQSGSTSGAQGPLRTP